MVDLFPAKLETVLGKASRTEQVVEIQVTRKWRIVLKLCVAREANRSSSKCLLFEGHRCWTSWGSGVTSESAQGSRVTGGSDDEAKISSE